MGKKHFIFLLIIMIIISGCSINFINVITETIPENTEHEPVNSETDNDYNAALILKNQRYGPHERNIYDIYISSLEEKTPLIIYIHSGAFMRNDKSELPEDFLAKALENNISVASINYPFISEKPLRVVIENIIYALQYFMYMSDEYNINKDYVGCFGKSAGAGASLLIAVNNDFADSDNENPILRESTDIFCAGLYLPQATYNSEKWVDILNIENFLFADVLDQTKLYIDQIYGIDEESVNFYSIDENNREFLDMYSKISSNTPPLYIWNDFSENTIDIIHSPIHSQAIYDKCIEEGVYAEYYHALRTIPEKDFIDFFIEQMEIKKKNNS